MLILSELLVSFNGSYSGVFIVLWCLCLLFSGISLAVHKRRWSGQFEAMAYWFLAILLVSFAAFRPIGIARDDLAYLEIYNGICFTLACDQWIQGTRDWGWYSIVGLLKSFWATPRVMLWLGAAALLVKFAVIYRLTRHPLLALLLLIGMFYEVLDLTAWRVALSASVFMVGFWLLVEGRVILGSMVTLCCGLFHKQAFAGILILFRVKLPQRFCWLVLLMLLPVMMMFAGWYPDIPALANRLGATPGGAMLFQQGIDGYVGRNYMGWRVAPVVYYPLILLAIWLVKDVRWLNNRLYAYASVSIVWASWFLLVFASLPEVQVRFFEFMILPVVFLAGSCRYDWWRFIGVAFVSGIFVVKYNILAHLLIGNFAF